MPDANNIPDSLSPIATMAHHRSGETIYLTRDDNGAPCQPLPCKAEARYYLADDPRHYALLRGPDGEEHKLTQEQWSRRGASRATEAPADSATVAVVFRHVPSDGGGGHSWKHSTYHPTHAAAVEYAGGTSLKYGKIEPVRCLLWNGRAFELDSREGRPFKG